MDIKFVEDYIAGIAGLPENEFVWLLGWNIAAGEWGKIGLGPPAAREYLLNLFSKLKGDLSDIAEQSSGRLQQSLMALRRGAFEEIQQEAPFSRLAQENMETLLEAWAQSGEAGFTQAWARIFPAGGEPLRQRQNPIQIVANVGDCEERALEVMGAPDQETRVSAEWWYLYYTFGRDWRPGMHSTRTGKEDDVRFSVHDIKILPDTPRQIYFRLKW